MLKKVLKKKQQQLIVKEIVVSDVEGKTSNLYPRTFNSYEELESFFISNKSKYPVEGYDKHNIKITWTNRQTYSYRADLSNENDCVEFDIKNRVILGIEQSALFTSLLSGTKKQKAKEVCQLNKLLLKV